MKRVLFVAALGMICLTEIAPGAIFVVTKTVDDNGPCDPTDCALREAVLAANALPGMDTVQVPAGTYQLSIPEDFALGGDLDITDDLDLVGVPGATAVVGTGFGTTQDRVIDVSENEVTVTLVGLEITRGQADLGGGIRVSADATMQLTECFIHDNEATIDGGGIFNAISRLTLVRTTVSSNLAQRHGGGISRIGISDLAADNLYIENSTISGNEAAFEGGAIHSFGGSGEMLIENSTIVGNQAGTFGSLIFQDFSIGPQFRNSILEGDCFFVASQFPMSLGGNVGKGTDFCFLDHPSDQDDVMDLGILPLGGYGGPTPTHALSQASLAVDAALLADCPPEDQRGEPRPIDGDADGQTECDSGAIELQPLSPLAIPTLGRIQLALLGCLMAVAALRLLR